MPTLIRALAVGVSVLAASQAGTAGTPDDREGSKDAPPAAVAERQSPTVSEARLSPLGVKPLDTKTLATKRGGTQVVNDMTLKGVVADNRVSDVATGSNVISDGAFSGSVGLPMVIQNTGNGVLIQNATIVNVQVK